MFDVAVIGAGPTAYAALGALQYSGKSVAVITGASPETTPAPNAKIASVSFERATAPGLAETARFPDGATVCATAETGGLANYWGQQLQTYGPADPWGAGPAVPDWQAYQDLCHAVVQDLHLTGGDPLGVLNTAASDIELRAPKLATGTRASPQAGLAAMSLAFVARAAAMPDLHISHARVARLSRAPDSVCLALSDGTEIVAHTVLLAAGVVGTSGILARSLPGIQHTRFLDHVPYMLYTVGLPRVLKAVPETKGDHFNALSLIRKSQGACDLFASAYCMSRAPISLLTASLGLGPWLRGRFPGKLADMVRPIQVWTRSTVGTYQHQPGQSRIEVIEMPKPQNDPVLSEFCAFLRSRGVRVHLSTTPPGQGFHYHGLSVAGQDGHHTPVDAALQDAFGGQVICIDASVLTSIGCQPHTLTSMAQALGRTRFTLQTR